MLRGGNNLLIWLDGLSDEFNRKIVGKIEMVSLTGKCCVHPSQKENLKDDKEHCRESLTSLPHLWTTLSQLNYHSQCWRLMQAQIDHTNQWNDQYLMRDQCWRHKSAELRTAQPKKFKNFSVYVATQKVNRKVVQICTSVFPCSVGIMIAVERCIFRKDQNLFHEK